MAGSRRKFRLMTCVAMGIFPWTVGVGLAQEVEKLFVPFLAEQSQANQNIGSPPIRDKWIVASRPCGVNLTLLNQASNKAITSLQFNLFNDISLEGEIEQVIFRSPRSYTLLGSLKKTNSGHFILSVHEGILAGNIRSMDGSSYQVRYCPEGFHETRTIDDSKYPECGVGPEHYVAENGRGKDSARISPSTATSEKSSVVADDGTIFDVMVVYTPAARTAAGGTTAMEGLINLAIGETNVAYANSGITPRVRLVHQEEIAYTESSDIGTDLGRLRDLADGYMDTVHSLRNTYGADLVSLFNAGTGAGVGYVMTTLSSEFESQAFSVTRWDVATGNYTFGHEFGHNMGCKHAVGDGSPPTAQGDGLYNYSHGWRFNGDTYRTIMAYSPGMRIQHFSNPNVNYSGFPTGQTLGQSNEAHNALSINNAAFTIANWRQTTLPVLSTNFHGFSVVSSNWMRSDCDSVNDWCSGADMAGDGIVDLEDIKALSGLWLNTIQSDGLKWIHIDDPGVSGHEPFNGLMSKYETTNAQYAQFLNAALASDDIYVSGNYVYGDNGSNSGADFVDQIYYNLAGSGSTENGAVNGGATRINYNGSSFTVDSGFEDHPVTYVSWYGATAFCNYYGYRLPTEWEWQAVADYDGTWGTPAYGCGPSINNSIANYQGSTHPDGTTLVGSFGTYGYGTCDMAGNVWEWTSSIYPPNKRILRSGAWGNPEDSCTVSHWNKLAQNFTFQDIGFRVCRDNQLDSGLIAYYKLDGTSGVVTDEVSNNNGTIYGATRGLAGKVGNCFEFDGVNDYVNVPYSPDFAYTIGIDRVTVSAWVYPHDKDSVDHGAIYSDRAVGNNVQAIGMKINQGGFGLSGWAPSATGYAVEYVPVPSNNQWYLMTAVFDSSEAKLYINGALESSVSLSGVSLTNGGTGITFSEEQGDYWENYFDGKIDEVKIWSRALSASEVMAVYNEAP